jgi:hypothetical protein
MESNVGGTQDDHSTDHGSNCRIDRFHNLESYKTVPNWEKRVGIRGTGMARRRVRDGATARRNPVEAGNGSGRPIGRGIAAIPARRGPCRRSTTARCPPLADVRGPDETGGPRIGEGV